MSTEILKGLEKISQTAGCDPAEVQGGGGNTSAKLDEKVMAIKASGYQLSDVTAQKGYVKVDYQKIKQFFEETPENLNEEEKIELRNRAAQMIEQNVISREFKKPSVETGFHSFLKRYVLHTHSVYANIICCSCRGQNLMERIFSDSEINPLWVNYIHPGFDLTREIKKLQEEYLKQQGQKPSVIFLENHGLVTTEQHPEKVLSLNSRVNEMIRASLNIKEKFPKAGISRIKEGVYESTSSFLSRFFAENQELDSSYFEKMLFPDQIVYLDEGLKLDGSAGRISVDLKSGKIRYQTSKKEAQTIEETLTAVIYIREQIEKQGLKLQTMSDRYVDLIRNMKAESHRKKIMKEE